MKKITAFTLAEILITLGIVGIIAQTTIPILIDNTSKQYYSMGLKKAYTDFNQALASMTNKDGSTGNLKATGLFDAVSSAQADNKELGDSLIQHFKVIKTCGTAAGCFSQNVSGTFSGSGTRGSSVYNNTDYYKFITADGAYYALRSHGLCLPAPSTTAGHMKEVCGEVRIDINGEKGPNNWGRDIFLLYITNGKGPLLYAPGSVEDTWSGYWKDSDLCNTPNSKNWNCASRVMDEGWTMEY